MRSPGRRYLVANSGGYGFIVKSEELLSRVRAGKTFMTIEEGEEVLRPVRVPEKPVMAVTLSEHGRMLLFDAARAQRARARTRHHADGARRQGKDESGRFLRRQVGQRRGCH